MAKRRHTPEQEIKKLREAEVAKAEGGMVAEAARRIGVTEQTFYRWRSEHGGLGATRLQGAGSSSLHTAIQAGPRGR